MKPVVNPLEDLYNLIEKGNIEKDIECRGKVYRLRSLCDEDYAWRDKFVSMDTQLAMLAAMRAPTLAIATVAVDGVPVEQIPGLPDIDPTIPQALQDLMKQDLKFVIAYNLHSKVYSKLPREYVVELYRKFVDDLEKPSREVDGEQVKNS